MADGGPALQDRPREGRDLEALLSDIAALEALAADWPEGQRNAAAARVEAVDALNAEAFRRLIRALKEVPGMAAALRQAASDEVVYAVLRRHGILRPTLAERAEAALATIRPTLAGHGGDVELVSVEPPEVAVRLTGACDGCPASALTFYAGVKKAILDTMPEIETVRQVKGAGGGSGAGYLTSPFAAAKEAPWLDVMAADSLPEGETRFLELQGRGLILSRLEGRVTCFENACAHMGMALDGGEIEDGILTCPYHGFSYALASGECLTAPEVQLQPHPVRQEGARLRVQLGD